MPYLYERWGKDLTNEANKMENKKEIKKEIIEELKAEGKEINDIDFETLEESYRNMYEWVQGHEDRGEEHEDEPFEIFKEKYNWKDFDRWTADGDVFDERYGQKYIFVPIENKIIFVGGDDE